MRKMLKLHLFTGFENKRLGIRKEMELGHLYDDGKDQLALINAADKLGLKIGHLQNTDGFVHFDLWGKPLERAKQLFKLVTDLELYEDMKSMNRSGKRE